MVRQLQVVLPLYTQLYFAVSVLAVCTTDLFFSFVIWACHVGKGGQLLYIRTDFSTILNKLLKNHIFPLLNVMVSHCCVDRMEKMVLSHSRLTDGVRVMI